jgi:hypothetical protein
MACTDGELPVLDGSVPDCISRVPMSSTANSMTFRYRLAPFGNTSTIQLHVADSGSGPTTLWTSRHTGSSGFVGDSLLGFLWSNGSLRPWGNGETTLKEFANGSQLLRSYPNPTYSCADQPGEYFRHTWRPGPFGIEANSTRFRLDAALGVVQLATVPTLNGSFEVSCPPLLGMRALTKPTGWISGDLADPTTRCDGVVPPTQPTTLTLSGDRVDTWATTSIDVDSKRVMTTLTLRLAEQPAFSFDLPGRFETGSWGPPGGEMLTAVDQQGLDIFRVRPCSISRIDGPGRFDARTVITSVLNRYLLDRSEIRWHCIASTNQVTAQQRLGTRSTWRVVGDRLTMDADSDVVDSSAVDTRGATCSNDAI